MKAGSVSNHISAFWDVMPTFAEIAGVETPKASNGISFFPTLLDKQQQKEHEHLYWEFPVRNGRKAVRKGVVYNYNKNPELNFGLYNLSKDPRESNNVAEKHPDILQKLKQIMEAAGTNLSYFLLPNKINITAPQLRGSIFNKL